MHIEINSSPLSVIEPMLRLAFQLSEPQSLSQLPSAHPYGSNGSNGMRLAANARTLTITYYIIHSKVNNLTCAM